MYLSKYVGKIMIILIIMIMIVSNYICLTLLAKSVWICKSKFVGQISLNILFQVNRPNRSQYFFKSVGQFLLNIVVQIRTQIGLIVFVQIHQQKESEYIDPNHTSKFVREIDRNISVIIRRSNRLEHICLNMSVISV